jgi:hypothetical protein
MACYYCKNDGFPNNPDYGPCSVCRKSICTDPPVRPDKDFHGSECRCRCGELVCRYDMEQHATGKGGSMASCFPAMALLMGTATVTAAADELGEKRTASRLSPDAVDRFNDFLNFVAPGTEPLREAIERSENRMLPEVLRIAQHEVGEVPMIAFLPEFFSEGAIERVTALAADTVRKAWTAGRKVDLQGPGIKWLDARIVAFLSGLTPDVLGRDLLELAAVQQMLTALTPPGKPVPATLVRALTYSSVPSGARAIADWMVEEQVSATAML